MGNKMMLAGLTAVITFPVFGIGMTFIVAAAIIAVVGAVLFVFDR